MCMCVSVRVYVRECVCVCVCTLDVSGAMIRGRDESLNDVTPHVSVPMI